MRQNEKMKNIEYPDFIPETRRPVETPDSIVTDGKAVFGTFDEPFKNLNIIDCKKPVSAFLPEFMKVLRIKEWEAVEVSFDEGFFLFAVYDTGTLVFNIIMFFDKQTKKVISRQVYGMPKKVVNNTLRNSTNILKTGDFTIEINNQFQDGKVYAKAKCTKKSKNCVPMSADVELTSCVMPCVAVMPLGKNKPLYSQKELFKAKGVITVGDKVYNLNDNAVSIIDDHKAYYPYHMHYDWVTGMGIKDGKPMGFNLTENQVIDPENYNENYIWYEGNMHPLPPIHFEHMENGDWHVTDKHGMVDVTFKIDNAFKIKVNALIVRTNYRAPFGTIYGTIKDLDGNVHKLDGLFGMGEDKTFIM